jgi:hypothetical protein
MPQIKKPVSEKLDRLYNSTIKCPYCGNKIPKYTSECAVCGISKVQIAEASIEKAKDIKRTKSGEKIVMTKYRPDDLSLTKMCLWLILGIFGAHCFVAGRKARGITYAVLTALWLGLSLGLFYNWGNPSAPTLIAQGWDELVRGYVPYPPFIFGFVVFCMWVWDWFAVIFGQFKYPVRLGEKPQKGNIKKEEWSAGKKGGKK